MACIASLLLLFLSPTIAHALSISEIAWMGTSVSYNCEWIELYNDSSDTVDLSAASLSINDKTYTLSGTIAPNAYFVIEREVASCPDPAPSTNNLLLAFGSIPNTGNVTIGISESSPVSSGENWSIGGDNTSKHTVQWNNGVWVTSSATPGTGYGTTQNNSANSPPSNSESVNTTVSTAGKAAQKSIDTVSIQAPSFAYVGSPVTFKSKTPPGTTPSLHSFTWNFGDMSTSELTSPTHTYYRTGTYVVFLSVISGKEEVTARKEIQIISPEIAFIARDSIIEITNNGSKEIDLGGYKVIDGTTYTIPKYTILTPKSTLTIPRIQQSQADETPCLLSPGNRLLTYSTNMHVTDILEPAPQEPNVLEARVYPNKNYAPPSEDEKTETTQPDTQNETPEYTIKESADATNSPSNLLTFPHFLLALLFGIGIFGIYIQSRSNI